MRIDKKKKGNNPKTYAIYGMMEYALTISIGPARHQIHFTGGRLSGYGIRPATYTTDDPLMQSVIERSEQYRSGRIVGRQ